MRNKDADQLRVDLEADQRLCFRYTDSTIPLLLTYKISSLQPSSVVVQPGLCRIWSETPKIGFLTMRIYQNTLLQGQGRAGQGRAGQDTGKIYKLNVILKFIQYI